MRWRKEGKRVYTKDNSVIAYSVVAVVAIVAITICFLAFKGYNSKITYSSEQEKIEVQATNSNSVK